MNSAGCPGGRTRCTVLKRQRHPECLRSFGLSNPHDTFTVDCVIPVAVGILFLLTRHLFRGCPWHAVLMDWLSPAFLSSVGRSLWTMTSSAHPFPTEFVSARTMGEMKLIPWSHEGESIEGWGCQSNGPHRRTRAYTSKCACRQHLALQSQLYLQPRAFLSEAK